ncbi:MFS general substrate transporter [Chlorella sorokiniana]|uniref:MFS general substrate transporter n=1 Tax=Chlorella sorokiniana TaxID=3076 RepID=A0A2P6TFI8_CHLSO|nr:MFS general substrate transporter [Chlorella sorokiniana]|eukprot:PRW32873.1 MFS general substrate transporter [Chlorella sorokiniana]
MALCGQTSYINRWHGLSASIFVSLIFGSAYAFPLWGELLKDAYSLTQSQLQGIASTANVAGSVAIVAGLVFDRLERHRRLGPCLVLLVGMASNAAGYSLLWAAVSGRFRAQLWQLAALAALGMTGSMWADTAAMATNVRNFPAHRGTVVGLIRACVGLSGSLFACIYAGAFTPDASAFLLFLAIAPVAVGAAALPFINRLPLPATEHSDAIGHGGLPAERRFVFALASLGTLALFLVTATTVNALWPLALATRHLVMAGACALLLPLLALPCGAGGLLSRRPLPPHQPTGSGLGRTGVPGGDIAASSSWASSRASFGSLKDKGDMEEPLLQPPGQQLVAAPPDGDALEGDTLCEALPLEGSLPGAVAAPELAPLQCLCSLDFWLLFTVIAVGTGSGLALLNNLAQVVAATAGSRSTAGATAVLLSIFSVANCSGRMAFGYWPERLLHSRGTPRTLFMPAVSALLAAAFAALAFVRLPALFPLTALAGFAYGGHWALGPATVSELFGLRHFAANYALMLVAPAVGSVGLAAGLAAWVYERAAQAQGETGTCLGPACFRATFLTMAAAGVCAGGAGAVLHRRSVALYQRQAARMQSSGSS